MRVEDLLRAVAVMHVNVDVGNALDTSRNIHAMAPPGSSYTSKNPEAWEGIAWCRPPAALNA